MIPRIPVSALVLLLCLSGCKGDVRVELFMDLRTDLVPGEEFATVESLLERSGVEGASLLETHLDFGADALSGVRIAEFDELAPGNYRVRVRLRDATGAFVVQRSAAVRVHDATLVTVVITRDCRGVSCDDSAHEVCLAGQCVPDTCTPETLESCPATGTCESHAECAAPAAACASARCLGGTCFATSPMADSCSTGMYCDPDVGCRVSSQEAEPPDAGSVDASSRDADAEAPPADAGGEGIILPTGTLDTSFNDTGFVTYNYVDDDGTSKDDKATGVAVDSEGRIVVSASGTHWFYAADDQIDMAVISLRLLEDGSFDPSYQFGALSKPGVTVVTDSRWSHGTDVVVDPSDNPVVCGYREVGGRDDPILFRYTAVGGQPDVSFGVGGLAIVSIPGEVQCQAVGIDPTDGSFALVGSRSGELMFLAKVGANGQVDTSFSATGYLVYDVAGNEHGQAVVVDAAGRIYVVGTVDSGSATRDVAVWRYLDNGTPDGTFSEDGIFRYAGVDDDAALGAALDADNNLVVVGSAILSGDAGGARDMLALRIDQRTGELDPSFGTGGLFFYDSNVGSRMDEANAVAIDDAGRIYVAGSSATASSPSAMAVWRLTPDGVLDTSFGGAGAPAGVFLTSGAGGGTVDIGWDVALDPRGRVIVAGETMTPSGYSDVAIWRIR